MIASVGAWLAPMQPGGDGRESRSWPRVRLLPAGVTVGRSPTCDITLRCDTISALHFHIVRMEHGRWVLQDLSQNGTVVGKTLVGYGLSKELDEGDLIQIPLSRESVLCLKFTLQASPARPTGAGAELRGRVEAATQRLKNLRREKALLQAAVEAERTSLKRKRGEEADAADERASLLAQRGWLQKELDENMDLRRRLLAEHDIYKTAAAQDLATLATLFSELVEVQRRRELVRGCTGAYHQFLGEIQEHHEASRRSLAALTVESDVRREQLRVSRAAVDAADDESGSTREALQATETAIATITRGQGELRLSVVGLGRYELV